MELLKVKMLVMPGLIRLNTAAGGGGGQQQLKFSYVWVLFCSLVSDMYSAGNSPDLPDGTFHIFLVKLKIASLKLSCE